LQHKKKKIFYAVSRYTSQDGSGLLPIIVLIQKFPLGGKGVFFKFKFVCFINLSALIKLHFLQHATTFDHSCEPPFDFGVT
jgi:hypothetical protein